MTRLYRWVLPPLTLWLFGWIALSWPAGQDDTMIHLRYADNLYLHHFITYDGVHANYGASSLLYVSLLAVLRSLSSSANLPRTVSSVVHVALFLSLVWLLLRRVPRTARMARATGALLLALVVMPAAVRWLDDGMETGLVLATVSLLAWLTHDACRAATVSGRRGAGLAALSFFAVLLRTELLLACAVCFCLLLLFDKGKARNFQGRTLGELLSIAGGRSYSLLGGVAALVVIVGTMHSILPDTAIAKSVGIHHWAGTLMATAVTLSGALSFGLGLLLFWLLTLALAAMQRGSIEPAAIVANSLPPIVLLLAVLRGQQIQGVRYFGWTFLFSIVWNIFELGKAVGEPGRATELRNRRAGWLLSAFAVLLILELPFETVVMHRILTRRAKTMRLLEAQHLDVLQPMRGVASDIGYIGYFSKAEICDLAGLVNGREAARMDSAARNVSCARTAPQFFFGNATQIASVANVISMNGWKICGRYDFNNLTRPDTHYLVVEPALVERVCQATASSPTDTASLKGL